MRVQVKLQDLLGTHLSLLYPFLAEPGARLQLYRWFSELTIISSPKRKHLKAEFVLLADFFGSSSVQNTFHLLGKKQNRLN